MVEIHDIRVRRWGLAGALLLATGCAAFAQDVDVAGKNVTLLGITSATVAPPGTLFGSVSGSTKRDGVYDEIDGSAELGFGFGNAEESVGAQVSVVVTSLTDNLGDSGYLTFKLSRRISDGPMPTYIGVNVDQIANWGDAKDVDPEGSIALTTFGRTTFGTSQSYPYMLTIGAGSNVQNNQQDEGLFLGAGIGLSRNVGLSAAWSGEVADFGAAFRLPGVENASFTATVNDVFDQEDSRRMTFSLNFAVNNVFGG